MAGKSSSGKHYTSKGQRPNVKQHILNKIRKESTTFKKFDLWAIWKQNKTDPWVTIENSNKNETAKKQIRVRASELWGDPRNNKPFTF